MGAWWSSAQQPFASVELEREEQDPETLVVVGLEIKLGFQGQPELVRMEFQNPHARSDWLELCEALEQGQDYELAFSVPNGEVSLRVRGSELVWTVGRYGVSEGGALSAKLPRALFAAPLAAALRSNLASLQ